MNRLLEIAAKCGTLPENVVPAAGEVALAAAEDANEALFAWACALAKTRTPRGYMRPEHAFAVAYALGEFYAVCAHADRIDMDALTACRVHYLGHISIDQAAEDAAESTLYEDLMQRAADLALHGRRPGPELVLRLMRHSIAGLMELADDTPEYTAVLAGLDAAVAAVDSAGQDAN